MKKLKIELNDAQNLKDLLQEAYMLADEQIIQAQNEINKLAMATNLAEEPIDGKTKYAKSINDYLGMKDKAISKKIEIAKILTSVFQQNGDTKGILAESEKAAPVSFNFEDIKKIVDSSFQENQKTKTIQIKR